LVQTTKVIQLPLPLKWWEDRAIWYERDYPATVQRETEETAFRNIYYEARIRHKNYVGILSELERQVHMLDTRLLREYPHYSPNERINRIAHEIGLLPFQTKEILRDIDVVMRDYDTLQRVEKAARAIRKEDRMRTVRILKSA